MYEKDPIEIQWLGHACFSIKAMSYTVVIDPYDENVRGHAPIDTSANALYCSHGHGDHSYAQGVQIVQGGHSPFVVETIASFHDDVHGAKRGENRIHVLRGMGKRIIHMGDLGHLLDPDTIAEIRGCDVLMIPVGGFYTIDAQQAADMVKEIQPHIVIPMHYRHGEYGFEVLGEVEPFLQALPQWKIRRYEGNSLEILGDMPSHIALLKT